MSYWIDYDNDDDFISHYGIKKRSGRYPWGSGKESFQHSGDFLSRIDGLKRDGLKEVEIARFMGMSTTQLRAQQSEAKSERRSIQVERAKSLKEKGLSNVTIAKEMGLPNESSVRSLLNPVSETRMNQARATADLLRDQIEKKGMIDIGVGVERELGVSREKLNQALEMLRMEGYPTYSGGLPQVTNPGSQTNLKVIGPKDMQHKDIYKYSEVNTLKDYTSHDDGETFVPKWVYPQSIDSKRVSVRYAEDGGTAKDGTIEIRPGVEDLSLGTSKYAQVRILVDDSKYLKGMAFYNNDMPDGVDVIFNTNKSSKTPKMDTMKPIKNDPDNPFGSLLKEGINDPSNPNSDNFKGGQSYYIDKNGNKKLSAINKRAEEGDWSEWSDKLPSQFLGKQNVNLIKKQLDSAKIDKQMEYDEILSLTNPTVKKHLLQTFANDCDSAAEDLKAAALPRQKYQVIMPINSLKSNEIYAPNYENGETVALVRYPHGGLFEIPILTVNNRNREGKKSLGTDALDAVGINSKVAEQLSGADFDGDTVTVIPTGKNIKISNMKPLKDLEGFDPKMSYGYSEIVEDSKGVKHYYRDGVEFKPMRDTQKQMGVASNLITDMTLKGASTEELAKAVKHSMVVIDAEKHGLDYKQSEIDNSISALKQKYQGRYEDGKYKEGASTLLSKSKGEVSVPKTVGSPSINLIGSKNYDPSRPEGSLIYKISDETYTDPKTGKLKTRTQQSTRMKETDDAFTLSSGTAQETLYADYANTMKRLANDARKQMATTPDVPYSKEANIKYKSQVDNLNSKLSISLLNAPRERAAQLLANSEVAAKKKDNPDMSKSEIKKANQQSLTKARAAVGAKRTTIPIDDDEWRAIQEGAISTNKLTQIINNADIDVIRERSMPRTTTTMTTVKRDRLKQLSQSGYTQSEIAKRLGVSVSVVNNELKS